MQLCASWLIYDVSWRCSDAQLPLLVLCLESYQGHQIVVDIADKLFLLDLVRLLLDDFELVLDLLLLLRHLDDLIFEHFVDHCGCVPEQLVLVGTLIIILWIRLGFMQVEYQTDLLFHFLG